MNHIRNVLLLVVMACSAAAEPSQNLVRFSSQPNDWFQSFEFRARPEIQPDLVDTIIVLLSRNLKNLEGSLLDPKWDRLAGQKNIGIVALGYNFQNKQPEGAKLGTKPLYREYPKAACDLLYKQLKKQIAGLYPGSKHYGFVISDDAIDEVGNIVTDSPKETRFMIIEDQLWSVPDELRSLPPCLVINRDKGKTARMIEVHHNNRWKKRDIAFIRDSAVERTGIDRFVSDFITTILSNSLPRPVIMDMETNAQYKSQVPRDKTPNTTWLPNPGLVVAWQALHSLSEKDRLPEIIKESILTGISAQPELHLYLKMPPTLSSGQPPKGVLCIATWLHEERSIYDLLRHGTPYKEMVEWANAQQMAVITWNTATLWKSGTSQAELEKDAARHFDSNFDAMTAAWDKCIRRLIMKYSIPDSGYLFFGSSRGAHWGHRLVLRRPERFAAVHIHIANSYDVPDAKARDVLWLITTGERDAGYNASSEFYRKCRNLDYPIIVKAGPNLAHADSEEILKLGRVFFEYAIELKKGEVLRTNLTFAPPTSTADLMRRDLAKSNLFGDFINQGVYEADQAPWVPLNQRIPLASREIAEAWGKREDK